jgi:hypothetical protein
MKPLNQNRMEQKQTAVEWLVENYLDLSDEYNTLSLEEIVKQAKEMEKEQIIEAYKFGNLSDIYFKPEQYYKETFKSE